MVYQRDLGKLLILVSITVPNIGRAQTVTNVPPSSIASGKPVWVASDRNKSAIDALVDIGDMRQVGDALDISIRWPYAPTEHGHEQAEEDRVICQPDEAISFDINDGFIGADGQYHKINTYNPIKARQQAEHFSAEMAKMGGIPPSYGTDPRSLACWAAARKCAGQNFTWPPPPNNTPLENTPKATEMNDKYNKSFVPTCTLK
jgi:hypothetical protein